jgi:predicted TIM-barrel enzyme
MIRKAVMYRMVLGDLDQPSLLEAIKICELNIGKYVSANYFKYGIHSHDGYIEQQIGRIIELTERLNDRIEEDKQIYTGRN